MIMRFVVIFLTCSALSAASALAEGTVPPGLFLTWQQDPTTTMTIDWHTEDDGAPSTLRYREADDEDWRDAEGASHPFPYSDRTIHRVELTGLSPNSEYVFELAGFTRALRFRTMPATLTEPLRIAIGGDVRHEQAWMEKTNRAAMARDPHFIVWGGDLAYADADPRKVYRWYEFYDAIINTLITPEGRVVPIVVALGNHEVFWRPRHENEPEFLEKHDYANHEAVFFYDLFAFPERPGYATLDFGNYLSLIILNSDHGAEIPGEQADWLADRLAERAHMLHVVPIYHVPAYPSVRDFDGWASPEIREHWVPHFERHGVRVAFEHHDHAYKRTYPIREGKVDDQGIVFIGDGNWGVGIRNIHDVDETWYLTRAEELRHFILMTLQGREQHFLMVDEDGQVFDEYPEPAR